MNSLRAGSARSNTHRAKRDRPAIRIHGGAQARPLKRERVYGVSVLRGVLAAAATMAMMSVSAAAEVW